MTEENEKALEVYSKICAMFDANGLSYKKLEEDLTILCGGRGDDLPMDFVIQVRPRNDTVAIFSELPFAVEEDKRLDMAVAVCAVNYLLVDGCFDFDISDGQLLFRMNNSYMDCDLDMEVFDYMFHCAVITVDKYNDKFLMLAKGYMKIEAFLTELNGGKED